MEVDGNLTRGQQPTMASYNDPFYVPRQFVMGSHTESYVPIQTNMYAMEQGATYNEPPAKQSRTMMPLSSPPVTPQPSSHYNYHSNQPENSCANTPAGPVKLLDESDQPVTGKINFPEQGWICTICHSMFTVKDYLLQHLEAIHQKGSKSQNTDSRTVSNGSSNPFRNLFKSGEAKTQSSSKFPNLLNTQEVGIVTKIKKEVNNDFEYLEEKVTGQELDSMESSYHQTNEREQKVDPQDMKGNLQSDLSNLNWICAKCHLLFNNKYLVEKHMEEQHGISDGEISGSCDGFMCGMCNLVVKLRASVREHLKKKHRCHSVTSTNVFKVIMTDRKSPPSDVTLSVTQTHSQGVTRGTPPQKTDRDDKLDMYEKQLTEQQGFPSLRMLSCWALNCQDTHALNKDAVISLVKLRKYKSPKKGRGHPKGYICPLACGYNSNSFQAIIQHQLTCLQNGFGYRRWICFMCKSTFDSKENLAYHHETMCQFPNNNYNPTNKKALDGDAMESTVSDQNATDESALCEICKKTFSNLGKMKLHMKMKHTFNIFYTCQICWKSLEQNKKKENMLEHLWKIHRVKQIWTDLVSCNG